LGGDAVKVLLFSGGIDSSALAWWCSPDILLTINYGQRVWSGEKRAAQAIAAYTGAIHEIVVTDLSPLGSGSLASKTPVMSAPSTEWWPYRNQLLITIAAMRFVTEGPVEILIGSVASDTTHSDGRAEFRSSINHLLSVQEGMVSVAAPASALSSIELVRSAGIPLEVLGFTFSCHVSDPPCAECRGCIKHRETLTLAGAP
jgi:7-cyano-7-deazaguanine synthase